RDLRRCARLRCTGIDVVELLEARRVLQLTELREPVTPDMFGAFRGSRSHPVREGEPLPGKHDKRRGKQGPAIHLKLHGGRNTGGQSAPMLGAFSVRRQWRMCRDAPNKRVPLALREALLRYTWRGGRKNQRGAECIRRLAQDFSVPRVRNLF